MPLANPIVESHPGYISGRWYCPIPAGNVAGGAALTANVVKLLPFRIFAPVVVTDLAVVITTLAAGGNVRAGIYASDPATRYPTGNPLVQTGNIATDSAVPVSADVTDTRLNPGWHWMATIADNATVILKTFPAGEVWAQAWIGSATLNNAVGAAATEGRLGFSFASAFGALPDLTGQSLTEFVSAATGLVYFKAA